MATEHPHYPGVLIYWEKDGEMPRGGAFYAQQYNHSLIWYAARACPPYGKEAYKFWKNINKNTWNRENLVYRQLSTSCYSKKVSSDLAMTTENPGAKGAFIALCQVDVSPTDNALGAKFPIVWIPPKCDQAISKGAVPQQKVDEDKTPGGIQIQLPTIPKIFPSLIPKTPTTIISTLPKVLPTVPVVPTTPDVPDLGPWGPGVVPKVPDAGYQDDPYGPDGPDGPVFGKEGWPWWVWLLILAGGTTAGAVAYKKSKKGKKRGRK
jgi:hypothetical protein